MIPVNFYGRVEEIGKGKKWVDTQVIQLESSFFFMRVNTFYLELSFVCHNRISQFLELSHY